MQVCINSYVVFNSNECAYKGVEACKAVLARDFVTYDMGQHFMECNAWIEEQLRMRRNTLVHCHAGVSRSVAVVIAYLMNRNQWTLDQAYGFVKSKRNTAKPNDGFLRQLK